MTRLTFMDVTCADDRQESLRMTNEMLAGDLPGFRLEKRYIRKDGSLMWASTVVTDLKGDDGRPLFGLAMVEDISARKRHERELAQKNEELQRLNDVKNQFLGMAAHDLRNPVAVIFAASSFMLEEESRCLSPEKRVEFVQRIRANSQFMARLLEDLLDLSRIEAGQIQLQKQALDLSELVGRSVEQNGLLAAPKEIRVDFACDSQLPKVAADAGRLDQVLNNLISNAVKFSNPGTTVTVNAARQNGSVVVSVQDRGQGIPADEMSRLFKPFQKTSVRGTAGERSTGLGLAICRQIIEAHGGRIWAESTAGKGSTFAFTLPAERAAGHSEQ
jgi:signal transduction histidine kinase